MNRKRRQKVEEESKHCWTLIWSPPAASLGGDNAPTSPLLQGWIAKAKNGPPSTIGRATLIHGLTGLSTPLPTGPQVSRKHAVMWCEEDEEDLASGTTSIFIKDLESKFGTEVNKKRLPSGVQTPLKEGDVITFGGRDARFIVSRMPAPVIAYSGLSADQIAMLNKVANVFGWRVVSRWSPECTHLIISQVKPSLLVLQTLVCNQILVHPAWLDGLKLDGNMNLSCCAHYLPPILSSSPLLQPNSDISFSPNPLRRHLFSGLTILFVDHELKEQLEPLIQMANGSSVGLDIHESALDDAGLNRVMNQIRDSPQPIELILVDDNQGEENSLAHQLARISGLKVQSSSALYESIFQSKKIVADPLALDSESGFHSDVKREGQSPSRSRVLPSQPSNVLDDFMDSLISGPVAQKQPSPVLPPSSSQRMAPQPSTSLDDFMDSLVGPSTVKPPPVAEGLEGNRFKPKSELRDESLVSGSSRSAHVNLPSQGSNVLEDFMEGLIGVGSSHDSSIASKVVKHAIEPKTKKRARSPELILSRVPSLNALHSNAAVPKTTITAGQVDETRAPIQNRGKLGISQEDQNDDMRMMHEDGSSKLAKTKDNHTAGLMIPVTKPLTIPRGSIVNYKTFRKSAFASCPSSSFVSLVPCGLVDKRR